jgi:hypothetical protein
VTRHLAAACLLAVLALGAVASEPCTAPDTLIDDSTREATEIYRAETPASVMLVDGRRIEVREGTFWAEVGRISRGEVYADAEAPPGSMLVVRTGEIVGVFDAITGGFCGARSPAPLRLRWIESR